MKKYNIEVEEIFQKVYEINANTLEEAKDKAVEMYRNEEIIVDYNDLKETNYREFLNIVEKNKKKDNDIER